ncbi:MAG: D-alanine--D-alanine ligase family protein [bacterium]|nr:D-alanine--D-alanine ligase family protein [bacterium]
MAKLNLGVFFGGKSTEHEISLISAKNIIDAADKNKYNIIPVGIDKNGEFLFYNNQDYILDSHDAKKVHLGYGGLPITFSFGRDKELIGIFDKNLKIKIDVAFPVLHGSFGEDGTIQGLFEMANIPYVGAGVLGSVIGMNKDIAKKLLEKSGVKMAKFLVFDISEKGKIDFSYIISELKCPFFIKPTNSGSSVGVYKIKSESEFREKTNEVFKFCDKIMCEEAIVGKEIECSVLGNDNPAASLPGEVITSHEFYSYDAKYLDENGAQLKIPADLPEEATHKIQETAVKIFKLLNCTGMARVDGFLQENGDYIFSEINTIPGFTPISMYPKLWELNGISQTELVSRLIQLAIDKNKF